MRILLVSQMYPGPGAPDLGTFVRQLEVALRDRGHELELAVLDTRRGGKRQYFRKKKVCRFCVERVDFIDYKKAEMLQPFVQERGKILPRRMTGTCSRHQRWLGEAIKRARNIALLPFATEL